MILGFEKDISVATRYAESDAAHIYCLRATGHLDQTWASRLAWVEVQHDTDLDGKPITVLTGALPDQSALVGVVNLLFDLGMELISLNVVDD